MVEERSAASPSSWLVSFVSELLTGNSSAETLPSSCLGFFSGDALIGWLFCKGKGLFPWKISKSFL